jgi:hypothetical protein
MKKVVGAFLAFLLVGAGGLACKPPVADGEVATRRAALTGSWSMVTSPLPNGWPGTGAVLTDGRLLLSGAGATTAWYTFTPDATGSYQNGTWTQIASSPNAHWAHPSFVMRDGRFWSAGGEYPQLPADRATVDIFDSATNTWSTAPDMPEEIADTPAAVLGDGRILVLAHTSSLHSYIFNSFGVSPSWTSAAPWSSIIGDTESSSLLLPDGSVLVGSRQFQRYLPDTNTWVDAALPPGGANGLMLASGSDEFGPMLLLHDGRAMVLGANNRSGLYTPPAVATDPGSWTSAADLPAPPDPSLQYSHGDAPSVVEPDGRALTVVTTDGSGLGLADAIFYEYDPPTDAWTQIATPFTIHDAETVILLALPNGQIWVSGSDIANAWLYTPAGVPQAAWRPTITSVSAPSFGEFTLGGVQLSGLTTGGDFGDDNKMATNYPLVWLDDGAGHVSYCRTYNFDQMVPRPSTPGSATFTIPTSVPDGAYTLHVAANGVEAGNTVPVSFAGPHVISVVAGQQIPGFMSLVQVRLDRAAPAGGVAINISNSRPDVITVPSTGTVPEGMTFVNLHTSALAYGRSIIKASTVANARFVGTASFGWAVATLSGPALPAPGTSTATWTVTLDRPAVTGGVVVNLQSDNAAVTVPATVTVPSGASSASFDVTVVSSSNTLTTITASMLGSSQSATFGYLISGHTIAPNPVPILGSGTATVTLDRNAPPGGVLVSLQNLFPAHASVPASVTVPEGSSTATYPVSGLAFGIARVRGRVTSGSFRDASAFVDYVQAVQSVSGPPVPADGNTATWTVTLVGSPPPGDAQVSLQSSNPSAVSVPASVTVPSGATSATFDVTMLDPTAPQSTITATLGGVSQTGIFGYQILSHTADSTVLVIGGPDGTATVTLNGNAPAGGLLISLQNLFPTHAIAPASVTVPAGASTATYAVTGIGFGTERIRARIGTAGAFRDLSFFVGF